MRAAGMLLRDSMNTARRLSAGALASSISRRPINWDAAEAPPDLNTQTLVIVGLGAVGSRIARFARELGLRVVGIRRMADSRTGRG